MTDDNRIILPPGVNRPAPKVEHLPKSGRAPKAKDAKRLCRDYGAHGVIILHFDDHGIGSVVAGHTERSMTVAQHIANQALQMIAKGPDKEKDFEIERLKVRIKELEHAKV